MLTALRWFDAISVGSLITSAFFYLAYDQWRPLVWAAIVVAIIKVVQHFIQFVENLDP